MFGSTPPPPDSNNGVVNKHNFIDYEFAAAVAEIKDLIFGQNFRIDFTRNERSKWDMHETYRCALQNDI